MAIANGMPVRSGTYFNSTRFTFAQVKEGEALKGSAGDRWVRVPLPLAVVAAPIVGGLFVVAFPVIGVAALAYGVVRKLAGGVKEGAADLAANLVPGPLPGEAHLTGKPGEEGAAAEGEAAKHETLDALGKKIEEKRRS
jgi:hypothetical protein